MLGAGMLETDHHSSQQFTLHSYTPSTSIKQSGGTWTRRYLAPCSAWHLLQTVAGSLLSPTVLLPAFKPRSRVFRQVDLIPGASQSLSHFPREALVYKGYVRARDMVLAIEIKGEVRREAPEDGFLTRHKAKSISSSSGPVLPGCDRGGT